MNIWKWTRMLVMFVLLLLVGRSAHGIKYSGGAGTLADPYQIGTPADWTMLSVTNADWDSSFVLIKDVDLSGMKVTPVGDEYTKFTGMFDGDGHVLRNAIINQPANSYVGLFGCLGMGGAINNLGVENAVMTGCDHVGSLVGENCGVLTSCSALGLITGKRGVGGLVGTNSGGAISLSCATGPVSGGTYVGGLVGMCRSVSTVTTSYATGSVSGDTYVGGLAGNQSSPGSITACYATGATAGKNYVGGLVGANHSAITSCFARGMVTGQISVGGLVGENTWGATISSCYATGTVSGNQFFGGLVGLNDTGLVLSCYWDRESSGRNGSSGGVGRTTAEMTYPYAVNTYEGWNFTDVWVADTDYTLNNGYPYLLSNIPSPVTLSVVPFMRSVNAAGGVALFDVMTDAAWSTDSSASWATISDDSGQGNATLAVTCTANTGAARNAAITVTGTDTNPIALAVMVYQLPGAETWEADVAVRPDGDSVLLVNDWVLVGRFVAGLDTAGEGSEFQRTDCAPLPTAGDGWLLVNDWVQTGRYVAGLDALQPQAGPTALNRNE